MRIGEVAARTGVSVRSLRYYEQQELLPADRSASGQRHYPDSAVDRVRLIQQLYAAGLPSRVVRHVLPCVDAKEPVAPPALQDQLATERARIDERIADLLTVRDRLDGVIAIAQTPRSECPDPL
ncbi:MerR family transcriptional regulator [Nocardiopsis coralliicola]